MNIKKNIEEVKKELSADEQMLASAFKLEKFYKRHKIKIFTLIGAIVLFVVGNQILDMLNRAKLESANSAYLTLLENPNDKDAKETLKAKNPKLFELYRYSQAVKDRDKETLEGLISSKNFIIKDISGYHLSILDKKEASSKFYSDFAIVYNSYLSIKSGNSKDMLDQLSLIHENSPLFNISQIIQHYAIKGK
jgi:hypothetical protein